MTHCPCVVVTPCTLIPNSQAQLDALVFTSAHFPITYWGYRICEVRAGLCFLQFQTLHYQMSSLRLSEVYAQDLSLCKAWDIHGWNPVPHVSHRLLSWYLVLKKSLVFPFIWDKMVCFLASCLGEVGMDPWDAFCTQSLFDILWLILWAIFPHSMRKKKIEYLKGSGTKSDSAVLQSTWLGWGAQGLVPVHHSENLFIAPFYSWRIITGQPRGK